MIPIDLIHYNYKLLFINIHIWFATVCLSVRNFSFFILIRFWFRWIDNFIGQDNVSFCLTLRDFLNCTIIFKTLKSHKHKITKNYAISKACVCFLYCINSGVFMKETSKAHLIKLYNEREREREERKGEKET